MNLIAFAGGLAVGGVTLYILKNKLKAPLKTQGTADEVVRFFEKKGLSKVQAVGIAGNLQEESRFNTEASGDNGSAYGIAQWRGGRLKALLDWADSQKKDVRDFYTQLNFLWRELNTSEKPALAKLINSNTVESASSNFATYYERPQASTIPRRITNSKEIYSAYA